MAVVDLQQWDRNMRSGNKGITSSSSDVPSNFNIMRMCDLIGRPLLNGSLTFHIDDGRVIDGKVDGNAARWINHACTPNCEAEQDGEQVFIHTKRAIKAGEELFYDYGLIIDERYTPKLKKQFECRCGSPRCRGTMLAPRSRQGA